MSSQIIIPKEKYEALIKEIRLQRSIPVLEKIYEDLKTNKENLFNDSIVPFQFSSDLIWFLQNNIINVQMQSDIFKLYIEAFFNPKSQIENINQIKFIFDIFIYDTVFYSQSSNIGSNFKVFLTKFFNLYYPKDTSIKHKEGDIMDVYINEERNKSFFVLRTRNETVIYFSVFIVYDMIYVAIVPKVTIYCILIDFKQFFRYCRCFCLEIF